MDRTVVVTSGAAGLAPVDVLTAVAGPRVRGVRLEDRTVLRTPDAPASAVGNALVLTRPVVADELAELVDDAVTRFAHPGSVRRLVVPATASLTETAAGLPGVTVQRLAVLDLPEPGAAAAWSRRRDLLLAGPADARAWHGVTVLHRHGPHARTDAAGTAPRDQDDELRTWTDGLAELVAHGRARVLRADRFGTPVGAGVLVWEPRAEVGPEHAGLAVLTDLVVHPAHRGLRVATTVAAALLEAHLRDFPRARVATVVPSALVPPLQRAGWRALEELLVLAATGA